mgnify:CR=1 FL=1
MEAAELEQVLSKWLSPIQVRLTALEAKTQNVKPPSEPSPNSAEAAQVHGLCDDPTCQPCAVHEQEVVDNAYHQGEIDTMERLDQWLILAGGEDLRQRVIQLAARGQQIDAENQQVVKIVA